MDVIIVSRHGESVESAAGIKNGDPDRDPGLTTAGQEQARELGRELAGDPIDLCVTSRFPRTRQTAALALAGRDIPCTVDPNLDDIDYGEFEGQPKARYDTWAREHTLATPIPGGESRVDVVRRLCAAFEALLARSEHCALVVTHDLVIDDLLRAIDDLGPETVHRHIPYATPYRLTVENVSRAVLRLRRWPAVARHSR